MNRNEMFVYPGFDGDGCKTLCTRDGNMLMDVKVYRMKAGTKRSFCSGTMETAVLLICGGITLEWEGGSQQAEREGMFQSRPWALHVSRGVEISVTAGTDSEIVVQQTHNDKPFPAKLYRPEDSEFTPSRYTEWESAAKRDIVTVFDYNSAPYSNMVLGEVLNHAGRWSSYIPHCHEQPEVYYYRYEKPQGFGACIIGDEAFKITDGSASLIPGGLDHPQVTAPGYPLGYVWMIRHLDGNPWTERVDNPDHMWLLEQ